MKKLLFLAVLVSAFFAACGGDSGSNGSDPADSVGRDSTDQGGDKKPLPDIPALAMDSVETEDDLTACVSSNEGDSVYVKAAYSIFRCDDELWKSVGFVLQRAKTKDKLPKCNRDLTGLMVLVADSSVAWRCVLGEWVEMGKAYKQDKDLPNCTSNRVDETVFVESDGSMLVCDGRWREYEPEDKLYCGTRSYDPAEEFCVAEKLYDLCGGKDFDPAMQFCYEDSLYALCGGEDYRPTRRFCVRDTLYDMCDGADFDPTKKFCANDELYDLCGGEDYRPTKQFCASSVVYDFCNGDAYDPTKKFCSNDELYDLCGGKSYDVDKERCEGGKVMGTCGSTIYDAGEKFCVSGELYVLCGGATYDVMEKFCSGGQTYNLCDGADYDVTTKFCSGGQTYDLCDGEDYDVTAKFCSGGQTYDLCGGEIYDVTVKFCSGGQTYDLCDGEDYDVTAKFCSGGQTYDLCGGEIYDVTVKFCSGGQTYDLCSGEEYDVTTKFCSGSLTYDLCGGASYDVTAKFCSDSQTYDLCGGSEYDVEEESCVNGKIKRCNTYDKSTHFCDKRDLRLYRFVTIGSQTWMAENLKYSDSTNYPSMLKRNWCQKNSLDSCTKYGRLYTWSAAIDSVKLAADATNPLDCGYGGMTCNLTGKVQGICPSGWHLPDTTEWNTLFAAVGGISSAGAKLRSQSGWPWSYNGEDALGFSALPAGRYAYGDFYDYGYNAYFWSSTVRNQHPYSMSMPYYDNAVTLFTSAADYGCSVRCLKD